MKTNKVKLYANALAEVAMGPAFAKASAGEQKKIINNFLRLLEKNNLEKKAKEIVELAENIILVKQGKNKITFLTARKITPSQKKILDKIAKKGDKIKEKINHEIVAGIKIIINDNRQFDASMQRKLQNIF